MANWNELWNFAPVDFVRDFQRDLNDFFENRLDFGGTAGFPPINLWNNKNHGCPR